MSFPLHISRSFVAVLFITGSFLCNSLLTEAKPRRSRRVIAASKSKSVRNVRAVQFNPERDNGYQQARTDDDLALGTPQSNSVSTNNIEIIENVNSNSRAISRLTDLPAPEEPAESKSNSADPSRMKTLKLKMEASRVIQIQQALAKQGFYQGGASGKYDEATVDAMRRFQASENITVTGYPTAQALKKLGLAR